MTSMLHVPTVLACPMHIGPQWSFTGVLGVAVGIVYISSSFLLSLRYPFVRVEIEHGFGSA